MLGLDAIGPIRFPNVAAHRPVMRDRRPLTGPERKAGGVAAALERVPILVC